MHWTFTMFDGVCNWSMNKHSDHLRLLRPDEHQPNGFCAAFGIDNVQKAVQQLIAYAAIDWITYDSIWFYCFGRVGHLRTSWTRHRAGNCSIDTFYSYKKKLSFILISIEIFLLSDKYLSHECLFMHCNRTVFKWNRTFAWQVFIFCTEISISLPSSSFEIPDVNSLHRAPLVICVSASSLAIFIHESQCQILNYYWFRCVASVWGAITASARH